jgi:carboxyl-terminal processing protease
VRERSAADLKYTEAGRKVYGGGGIEPDYRLEGPTEGFSPSRYGRMLFGRQAFGTFAQDFSAEGDTRIAATAKGRRFVAPRFAVDAAMLAAFKQHLQASRIAVDEAGFARDLDFIKAMIQYEININLFGVAEARRHLIAVDPQARLALTLFPDAERLVDSRRTPAPVVPDSK